jgi:hypothetical protein
VAVVVEVFVVQVLAEVVVVVEEDDCGITHPVSVGDAHGIAFV